MKKLQTVLLIFATWIRWLFVSQYFFCPRFSEQEALPFEGPRIFNPYDSPDASAKWIKANFHAHTRAWSGKKVSTMPPMFLFEKNLSLR